MDNTASKNEERTGFSIETNFMGRGCGYRFYADGSVTTIDNILDKYNRATEAYPENVTLRIQHWWDLLSGEEKVVVKVDEKRTYRAVNEGELPAKVIARGEFSQLTLKEYFTAPKA